MVKNILIKQLYLITILIACFSYGQDGSNYVDYTQNLNSFKKLGFVIEPLLYFTKAEAKYGDYPLNNSSILRGRIGIEYTHSHEKQLSFKTGLYLDLIPFYNADLVFEKEELNNTFKVEDYLEPAGKLVFTIPAMAELKKDLAKNLIFNTQFGGEFSILSSGSFMDRYFYTDIDNEISTQVFGIYGNTPDFWLIPSLKIGSGFYFVRKNIMYQLNVSYRKSLVPYFKGEYQFGNLSQSEPTRGDFKMNGDYIGLKLSVFLKKR